jgi:hypothetical protein
LTCVFWAENAENKCKSNKQKQIPAGMTTRKAKTSWPIEFFVIPPITNARWMGHPIIFGGLIDEGQKQGQGQQQIPTG